MKLYHPDCKKCEFWVYHDSVGGWHCESGFRPLVRDDWPYDCREMARNNRKARIRLSGGYIQLRLFDMKNLCLDCFFYDKYKRQCKKTKYDWCKTLRSK